MSQDQLSKVSWNHVDKLPIPDAEVMPRAKRRVFHIPYTVLFFIVLVIHVLKKIHLI